jgi:epoxide hydrolase-like predicted phosphatase
MLSIKAVIFDFGGVMVRTIDPSGREKWEKILGLSRGELAQQVFDSEVSTQAQLGLVPQDAVWQHVAELHHLNPQDLQQLQEDFWSGDRLDMELVEFLRSLRPSFKTAILSNAWDGARRRFREEYRVEDAVDLIVISAEEMMAKPDPQIFALIARRMGILPEEAIFLDDFPVNIQAARKAGFNAVLFQSTPQAMQEIQTLIAERL